MTQEFFDDLINLLTMMIELSPYPNEDREYLLKLKQQFWEKHISETE